MKRKYQSSKNVFRQFRLQRGLAFGMIIIAALLAFEAFNYSTTDFALKDLLGDLTFFGVQWSTILAVAFCGIDFAGIARLFTPEDGVDDRNEAWYLFGAWLLAATMNAMLTWWGVSLAILNHQTLGNAVVERATLLRMVPIFVAVLVWLIRVLIIGSFSVAGDRIFSQSDGRIPGRARGSRVVTPQPARALGSPSLKPRSSSPSPGTFRPAPKPKSSPEAGYTRPEPTYTPIQMSAHDSSQSGVQKTTTPFSSRTSAM
jgi:hypothetical protein